MKEKVIFAIEAKYKLKMNEIKRIDTVQQYNDYFGMETLHPLVTVIDAQRG